MTSIETARSRKDIKRKTAKQEFLMEVLEPIVDGIAAAFGSRCEVVLHDLENLEHSVVKIANGHVTGRTVGDTISKVGLERYKKNLCRDFDQSFLVTKDGRHLKSTTILFKTNKNRATVALSINFDVTDFLNFNAATKNMFGISEEDLRNELADEYGHEIVSILNKVADNAIQKVGKIIPAMRRRDKIEIVRQLENQGYFLIKEAVKFIAGKLNVSASTIYSYLQTIRSEKNDMPGPT